MVAFDNVWKPTEPPVDPYDWCRPRTGEPSAEFRARMLASIPEGLRRGEVRECPIATYFGLGRG